MRQLHFAGKHALYYRIWVENIFFTLLTLGLYYPWAKMRSNCYFLEHTELYHQNFSYLKSNTHSFLPFLPNLFSFKHMTIHFANISFTPQETQDKSYLKKIILVMKIFLSLFVISLMSSLLFNAQTTMTTWILSVIVFILSFYYYIYTVTKRSFLFIRDLSFGESQFYTYFKPYEWIKLSFKIITISIFSLLFLLCFYHTLGISVTHIRDLFFSLLTSEILIVSEYMTLLLFLVVSSLLFFYLRAYYVFQRFQYFYQNINLDKKIGFASSLTLHPLAWLMISNAILLLSTLGFAYPITRVRMMRMLIENTHIDTTQKSLEYYLLEQDKNIFMTKHNA